MVVLLLMDKILHDPKDPKLWELWYIPYNGQSRILSISSISSGSVRTTTDYRSTIGQADTAPQVTP